MNLLSTLERLGSIGEGKDRVSIELRPTSRTTHALIALAEGEDEQWAVVKPEDIPALVRLLNDARARLSAGEE